MNVWDVLSSLWWSLVFGSAILCTAFVVLLLASYIYESIQVRGIRRYQASKIWQEAYQQGVDDERTAAEWDIPEYRIPRRENPYGPPTRFEGDFHAH